jgi:pimeloyl-ACP methyl ester carboxylesterase
MFHEQTSLSPCFPDSFLSTGQFHIHYAHKGAGPPLILLHGGGTWLYSFRHNIDELSHHFSVYAIDLPGHGFTRPLVKAVKYDAAAICRSLKEFMDRTGISTSHFAGHSWGGGWAIFFADQHPDRVSKLVLINSSGMHRREHRMWEIMKIPILGKFLIQCITPQTIRKGLSDSFFDRTLVTVDMVNHVFYPLRRPEIRNAQLSFSRNVNWEQTRDAVARISNPALIIWGRHDRYIDVKYGRQMAGLMPHARFVVLENCGHSSHEECPAEVNRLMIDFLNDPR